MRPFLCLQIIEPPMVSASRVRVQSIPLGSTNLTSKGTQIYASFFVSGGNRATDSVGVGRASPIDPAWCHQLNTKKGRTDGVLLCALHTALVFD